MVLILLLLRSGFCGVFKNGMAWYHWRGGVARIVGTRIKTNSDYVVPINNEAKFYLGKQGDSFKSHKVFSKLSYHGSNNRILSDWVRKAGIDKHITPHCGRNTFCRNYWVYGKKISLH